MCTAQAQTVWLPVVLPYRPVTWRVRLAALESPSSKAAPRLATIGDGDGGGDHTILRGWRFVSNRESNGGPRMRNCQERTTRLRQLRHIFTVESQCSCQRCTERTPTYRDCLHFCWVSKKTLRNRETHRENWDKERRLELFDIQRTTSV